MLRGAAYTADGRESVSLRDLWRFLGFTLPYWRCLAVGVLTGLLRVLLGLFMPWYIKYVIDDVAGPYLAREISADQAWTRFGWVSLLLGALMAMHWVATLGRFYFPHRAGASAVRDVRYKLFRHLQRLSLGFHTQRPTGAIVARVIADVEAAQQAFDMILIQLSQEVLVAVTITAALFWYDWQWALVAFASTPLFVVTARLVRRPMRRATRQQRETVERISGHVQERFSMIREVQAYTAEPREERHVLDEAEELRRHTLRQQLLAGFVHASSEITRLLALAIVLGFGVYRITTGSIDAPGLLALFAMYTGRVMGPLNFLAQLYTRLQVAAAAADRVFDFFDTSPDIIDAHWARPLALDGPPTVRFEQVSFAYPTDNPVVALRDVDFQAPPGAKVVLVGESGAGKSTLLSLLPRFYDVQEGRVLVHDQDVRDVTVRSLRQAIAVVPQEPLLFSGTIRENILYGRPGASEEEVRAAARDANAEGFILATEQGYDTELGERGVGLSGGQVQRIAIARAFLKDPAILILDEPTSNLDATSEGLVMAAIDRLAAGRTTFIIAHRLSLARDADLIIAFSAGRIAQMGTHSDLLQRGGTYAQLWNRQVGMA